MKKSGDHNTEFESNANSDPQAQNAKQRFVFRSLLFAGLRYRGVTLLLVIFLLTAFLSISLGIFTSVFTELRLSGEIADSFVALYAADEAVEWGIYTDRNTSTPLCQPLVGVGCSYTGNQVQLPNGSCYILKAKKTPIPGRPADFFVDVWATGEFKCGGGLSAVKRALQTSYIEFTSP